MTTTPSPAWLSVTSTSPAWFSALCRVVFPRVSQPTGIPDDLTQLWHEQGFTFLDPTLASWRDASGNSDSGPTDEQLSACGLVQLKNGPCGLLASVYAFLIRFLSFEPVVPNSPLLRPEQALCDALSMIIWQSKKNKDTPAQIVLLSNEFFSESKSSGGNNNNSVSLLNALTMCGVGSASSGSNGNSDVGLPQYFSLLNIVTATTITELRQLIMRNMSQFQAPGGILLFLFSVVLTRTVEQVKVDGLGNTSLLCSGNGHCRHELVNLLLIGKATASIHDASNEVACGLLGPGLEEPGCIGFLSPPNEQAMLGNCMKWPKLPIWVVLGGAHYTVLFCPSRNAQGTYTLLHTESFSKPTSDNIPCFHFNGLSSLHWRKNGSEMSGPRLIKGNILFFDWQQESKTDLAKFASNLDVKDMPWGCLSCTYKNTPTSASCIMCASPRPSLLVCTACTTQNASSSTHCSACSTPLPKAKTPAVSLEPWNCGVCGARQQGAAQSCTLCTALRRPPSAPSIPQSAPPDLSFFKCVQADDAKELSQPPIKQNDKARPDGSRYLFLVQSASPSLLPPPPDTWICAKCKKESPIASVHCAWCDNLHPCSSTAWYCTLCFAFNAMRALNCGACTSERAVTPNENKSFLTEPKGNDVSDAPYLCHTCSARNSVLVAPFRCAVCNSPRFLSWLAYWQSFSQLSAASKKAAYKMLPEIMFSLHILHPKISIQFPKESVPSLTT